MTEHHDKYQEPKKQSREATKIDFNLLPTSLLCYLILDRRLNRYYFIVVVTLIEIGRSLPHYEPTILR